MKIKTIVAAALLALSPSISLAMCNGEHASQEAMSCAEGTVWDAATSTCVDQATS